MQGKSPELPRRHFQERWSPYPDRHGRARGRSGTSSSPKYTMADTRRISRDYVTVQSQPRPSQTVDVYDTSRRNMNRPSLSAYEDQPFFDHPSKVQEGYPLVIEQRLPKIRKVYQDQRTQSSDMVYDPAVSRESGPRRSTLSVREDSNVNYGPPPFASADTAQSFPSKQLPYPDSPHPGQYTSYQAPGQQHLIPAPSIRPSHILTPPAFVREINDEWTEDHRYFGTRQTRETIVTQRPPGDILISTNAYYPLNDNTTKRSRADTSSAYLPSTLVAPDTRWSEENRLHNTDIARDWHLQKMYKCDASYEGYERPPETRRQQYRADHPPDAYGQQPYPPPGDSGRFMSTQEQRQSPPSRSDVATYPPQEANAHLPSSDSAYLPKETKLEPYAATSRQPEPSNITRRGTERDPPLMAPYSVTEFDEYRKRTRTNVACHGSCHTSHSIGRGGAPIVVGSTDATCETCGQTVFARCDHNISRCVDCANSRHTHTQCPK